MTKPALARQRNLRLPAPAPARPVVACYVVVIIRHLLQMSLPVRALAGLESCVEVAVVLRPPRRACADCWLQGFHCMRAATGPFFLL